MHRIVAVAFAALAACALNIAAAHAYDCDPEEVADVEQCIRGARVPSIRQLVPPGVRRPAEVIEACDPEEVDDVAKCLREAMMPGLRRSMPEADEPAAPKEKKAARKPETTPQEPTAKAAAAPAATVASSETPAKLGGTDGVPQCRKYVPSIGQLVPVPCSE